MDGVTALHASHVLLVGIPLRATLTCAYKFKTVWEYGKYAGGGNETV